jgi:hypothetical protein
MKFIFFFLLMGIMLLAGIFGTIFYVIRMLFSVSLQSGSKSWDRLVLQLRSKIDAQSTQLVAWDKEMLTLLSLNKANQQKNSFWTSQNAGHYTTIYDESVIAYAQCTMKNMGLTLVRTSRQEFILRSKGKETEIWVNQQPFGVFVNGVLLASGKNSRQLAQLDMNYDEVQFPVIIGEKTVAAVNNPAKIDAPIPRALTILKDLNAEEETIVIALTLMVITN